VAALGSQKPTSTLLNAHQRGASGARRSDHLNGSRASTIRQRLWVRSAQQRRQPPPSEHGPSTIDHRERLWDRAGKIAPHHLRFFSKKAKAI
jgi:hypothetical protein